VSSLCLESLAETPGVDVLNVAFRRRIGAGSETAAKGGAMRTSPAKCVIACHLVAAIALVTGCATQQQRANVRAMFQSAAAFCRGKYADPRLDPIRDKTPALAGIAQPTLEMLSDQSRPTDEQKAAILIYDRAAIECSNEFMKVYATSGPDYVAAYSQEISQVQADRAQLYQGKITFGEYITRGVAHWQAFQAALVAIDQQRQRMAIQRMRAGAAVMRALPAYQPPATTFQPMQIPPTINCTSQQMGVNTYTHCQ